MSSRVAQLYFVVLSLHNQTINMVSIKVAFCKAQESLVVDLVPEGWLEEVDSPLNRSV